MIDDSALLARRESPGASVTWPDFYVDRAPLIPWSVLGRCWAETEHPVIAVWQRMADGGWVIGCGRDAAAAQ